MVTRPDPRPEPDESIACEECGEFGFEGLCPACRLDRIAPRTDWRPGRTVRFAGCAVPSGDPR
jgi:hypothetical protein